MIARDNPSPSKDPFFDDPVNLKELMERVQDFKEGKAHVAVELHSAEEIIRFINSL